MEIDYEYTKEKIKIAKKIRPYVPTDYTSAYDKSLIITEKFIRIIEASDYINTLEMVEVKPVDLPPLERLQHIVNIVQHEAKSSKVENLGIVLDLLVNMDNYKKMFGLFTNVMRDKKLFNDPTTLVKLMDTFMDGKSEKDQEKIKDMSKMLDLFKMFEGSQKSKPNEN